jgi:hypothetical protein
MPELGPWMITAHNKEHAEYLVRSRAEQRGIHVNRVEVSGGSGGMWVVSAEITDPVEVGEAARLGEDTTVFHLEARRAGQPPTDG